MMRSGQTPYPEIEGGALTTWIYGPVPLLLNLPATLATDAVTAIFVAGVINLLSVIVPVALGVAALASRGIVITRLDRAWVFLLVLALWPNTSLHYIQADNAALAFGLLSNLLLARNGVDHRPSLWLAALCAALAVWSKQTAIGLVLAQLLWLAFTGGRNLAVRYAAMALTCGVTLAVLFIARFGFDGLWLNLVKIPSRLPPTTNFPGRTVSLLPHLIVDVVVPAIGLFVFRRTVWRRDSSWLLPALTWCCLLPTALTSAYKIGGASNSLNVFLYLAVPAVAAFVSFLKRRSPRRTAAWAAAASLAVVAHQMNTTPLLPMRPMTQHLYEAAYLARIHRDQIFFPWHPLATWFSTRRFYHTEDGLTTRELAGLKPSPESVRRDLPPRWSMTAVPGWHENSPFRKLQPATAQLSLFGKWSIFTWTPPQNAAPP
jgi:hypothetical protein